MKIQFCSDLHLEFRENRKYIALNPLIPLGDVLVLAGDIVPLKHCELAGEFFNYVSDRFAVIYWVPGNHEYYGSDIGERPSLLCEKIRSNLFLTNNQSIVYGGVRFLLSTLWSRISSRYEMYIQRNMADFSAIKYQKKDFTPSAFSSLHRQSMSFLKGAFQPQENEQVVVVTHHVPTLMNYPHFYKDSPLTDAFVVELYDTIIESKAACWIYGHHHVNTPDFMIGRTRMMTNQLGYVHLCEEKSFNCATVVEV